MINLSEMKLNVVLLSVIFTPYSDTNKIIYSAVLLCVADYIRVPSPRDMLKLRVKKSESFRRLQTDRKRKEKDKTH